jgi:2-(1,2-epoxy-1,2-dihydrophenyl)acetyl-CoA isomerase
MGDPYASVDGLAIDLVGGVLRLTLDRPAKRNAIDDVMMAGLIDALDAAGRDEGVRAVLLQGNGDHFCAGADIVARNAATPAPGTGDLAAEPVRPPRPRVGSIQRRVPSLAHRLIPLVLTVQVPVVCRVQGWAAGIGFQLALAADFTIAASDARFWEPFTERGFTPDSGATWLLPRVVGPARARELLLLGRALDGDEAAAWGAIHRSVAADGLDAEVDALVASLAGGPTVALGLTKWLLAASPDEALEAQLRNEAFALELSSRSEDFKEGMAAFGQKRPPDFTGR